MTFGLHCDCPVTPVDPLFTISAAVNRVTSSGRQLGPEQRISPAEALRGYTSDSARFSFEEDVRGRSEEHTSELQSLMRISYSVFCLTKTNIPCAPTVFTL